MPDDEIFGDLRTQWAATPERLQGVNERTAGSFAREDDSLAYFDSLVTRSELFRASYSEVTGFYVQPRLNATSEKNRCRIDRILVPSEKLVEAGWSHGPIGIEGKRSDVKLGRVVAQVMDYKAAAFQVAKGFHVLLEWIFIWPLAEVVGDIASVMAQSRIGAVHSNPWQKLQFQGGGINGITWHASGRIEAKSLVCGTKAGHR